MTAVAASVITRTRRQKKKATKTWFLVIKNGEDLALSIANFQFIKKGSFVLCSLGAISILAQRY